MSDEPGGSATTAVVDSRKPIDSLDLERNQDIISKTSEERLQNWPKGWKPYAALVSGFCGMANCWGIIMSFGTFERYYHDAHLKGANDISISTIGGVQCFLVLILQIVVGPLLDAQLHTYVVAAGGILTSMGFLGLAFTDLHHIEKGQRYGMVLLCQGIVAGIGMACFFGHSSHLGIQWFSHKKYFAVGVTSAGAAVGGLAYPLAISYRLSAVGFQFGLRDFASIVGGVSAIAFILGVPKPTGMEKRPMGQLFKLATWVDKAPFQNTAFVLFGSAVCFIFAAFYPLLFHITEWAKQEKFKNIQVVWFLTVANGCSIFGRIGSACLAGIRWCNPLYIHALTCFIAALVIFLMWPLAQSESHAFGFCVLLGILGGSVLGLPASGVAYLTPKEFWSSLGRWTGIMWASCSFLALAGPPLAGLLVRKFGISAVGYWTGANLLVAGALMSIAVRVKVKEVRFGETEKNERSM